MEQPILLNMKKSEPNVVDAVTTIPLLGHNQLLSALYYIWDVMERSNITMIAVGATGESIRNTAPLQGDKIEVAVRKNEWDSGASRIAETFAPADTSEENKLKYEFNGVPIVVHILNDSETLQQADTKIYHSEYFRLPNPIGKFLEEFPQFKV